MSTVLRWFLWIGLAAIAVLALAIAVFVTAIPPAPEAPETSGHVVLGETQWEGRPRTWITYVPEGLRQPAPLVLAFPGSSQTGALLRTVTNFGFEALADRDGFLLVYVEAWVAGGSSGPEWNECRKNTQQPAHLENVDDVGFILSVLDRTSRKYEVDPDRVYAMGVSDGGQMAYRMATEHPDRFSAIAAVVAQQAAPENSNCLEPQGPVSVLVMNGTADPVIPYEGGEAALLWFSAGQVQSIEGTLAHWKAVNGIRGEGTREELADLDPEDSSTVVRERWRGEDGREVVLYSIVGGGHTFPGGHMGAPEFMVGPTNRDIDASVEIWSFFANH
jgi:polyhydroxybutyrate depolymerase